MGSTKDIDDILDAIAEMGSPNRITSAELREWALEYLQDWDEEVARFPELAGECHWNLWMADYDRNKDAFFSVMVFSPSGIELVCGRGDSRSIRVFSESEFPKSIDRLIPEMKRRFRVFHQLDALPRGVAETWLGRSFPPLPSLRI
jgi:hypothetical protein